MGIGKMTEQDLSALAGLYRQFRGKESSLDEMRETFRRLKKDPNYTFSPESEECSNWVGMGIP
jgi:hypothetical protein